MKCYKRTNSNVAVMAALWLSFPLIAVVALIVYGPLEDVIPVVVMLGIPGLFMGVWTLRTGKCLMFDCPRNCDGKH